MDWLRGAGSRMRRSSDRWDSGSDGIGPTLLLPTERTPSAISQLAVVRSCLAKLLRQTVRAAYASPEKGIDGGS
jgi:hypothetical protein